MDKTLIFGHKNPDTDSICSAVVMEDLQKKLGINAQATRLGEINKETEYAFKYFGITPPPLIEKIESGSEVIMVDHNEFSQSVAGIEDANIRMFVDHHRISNFRTEEPVFGFAEPVGCTATVLYKLYRMNRIEIEPKMAALMLSAIISDTLLFKSPTCTKDDIEAAGNLEHIARLDAKEFGLALLKAGTDLSDVPEKKLITMDAKDFHVDGIKFTIGQVNTIDITNMLGRKKQLESEINRYINENHVDFFIFAMTDILNHNSGILALGERTDIVEKACTLKDNIGFLEGVVSRKKQLLPLITRAI